MDKQENRRSFVSYAEEKPVETKEAGPSLSKETRDNVDIALGANIKDALGISDEALSIKAPEYTTVKKGPLSVGFALIGSDYYYQIELLTKTEMAERDVMGALITAFRTVVPETTDVFIQPPPQGLDWPLWTFVVKGGSLLLGAKDYMERKLVNNILLLEFWT